MIIIIVIIKNTNNKLILEALKSKNYKKLEWRWKGWRGFSVEPLAAQPWPLPWRSSPPSVRHTLVGPRPPPPRSPQLQRRPFRHLLKGPDVGSSDPGPRGPKQKKRFLTCFGPLGPLPIDAPWNFMQPTLIFVIFGGMGWKNWFFDFSIFCKISFYLILFWK